MKSLAFIAVLLLAVSCCFGDGPASGNINGSVIGEPPENRDGFVTPIGALNFGPVLLNDGPIYMTLFNSSSQVNDLVSTNNIATPSGVTLGAQGIISGNSAAIDNGTANIAFSNSNALLQAFSLTNTFSFEMVVLATNAASGGVDYPLITKDDPNNSFAGVVVQLQYDFTPPSYNNNHFPATWFTPRFFLQDLGGHQMNLGFNLNVTNAQVMDFVGEYNPTNTQIPFTCWLNGNAAELGYFTLQAPATVVYKTNFASIFSWPGQSQFFTGKLQAMAVYTNLLSETQIKTHYSALNSQSYSPNQYWYNALLGTNTSSQPWIAPNSYFVYDTNDFAGGGLWVDVCTGFSGTNQNFLAPVNEFGWSISKCGQVFLYTNIYNRIVANGWQSAGVALDCSGNPLACLNRPSVLWSALSNMWVMAGQFITNNYGTNIGVSNGSFAFMATSPNLIKTPFTLQNSNWLSAFSNGTNIGDSSLFEWTNGSGYFVYHKEGNGDGIDVVALTNGYTAMQGSPLQVFSTGSQALEGVGVIANGTNCFILASPTEFFDSFVCSDCYFICSTNPIGTYTAPVSLFASTGNPYGTGLEGQTGAGVFTDKGAAYCVLDHWACGDLFNSTKTIAQLTFNGTNVTASIPPYLSP